MGLDSDAVVDAALSVRDATGLCISDTSRMHIAETFAIPHNCRKNSDSRLVSMTLVADIALMPNELKRSGRSCSPGGAEPTVIYRGIKIPPIYGERSATARVIRDRLREMYTRPRGRPANR